MDEAEEVGVVALQCGADGLRPTPAVGAGTARRPAATGPRTGAGLVGGPPSRAGVLQLQATVGNRAVGTLLRQAQAGPAPVSKDVPGLPEHVLLRVEGHLVTGSASGAQAAIDLVVGVLAARGEIDVSLLEDRRMRFDPTLTDEGHTQQWARPGRHGGFHPLPSTVRIGPPALVNASWLYTTVIHEYRHAESFQTPRSDPFKEVDAYLHNIERADEAGLDAGEVLELWNRLREEWADVPQTLRPLYADRYTAAGTTVRRITGAAAPVAPAVQRTPSAGTCAVGATVLTYAGTPGTERCITEDDPEFRADYIDNNIVLATGLCLPGTTWANIDHARVPTIRLTYRDGRQLTIPVADVPLTGGSRGRDNRWVTVSRPLARYEKRGDGFIYPIRTVGATSYVAYGDTSNILSLRAGLHETIEELQSLFTLLELGVTFAGAIAALGGMSSPARPRTTSGVRGRITSVDAPNTGGRIRFRARDGARTSTSGTSTSNRPPGESPKPPRETRRKPTSGGYEPSPKPDKGKAPPAKAGKPSEAGPDRQTTAGRSDKPSTSKKRSKDATRESAGTEEQTAAERDWDKAEAERRRQQESTDKPTTTEHGALREQQRGALTAKERGQLDGAVPRTQGDGATARVAKQHGGGYLVHVTTRDGKTVTLMRDKSRTEVERLSENYHWDPPFAD